MSNKRLDFIYVITKCKEILCNDSKIHISIGKSVINRDNVIKMLCLEFKSNRIHRGYKHKDIITSRELKTKRQRKYSKCYKSITLNGKPNRLVSRTRKKVL